MKEYTQHKEIQIQYCETDNFLAIAKKDYSTDRIDYIDEDGYSYDYPVEVPTNGLDRIVADLRKSYSSDEIFVIEVTTFQKVVRKTNH